MDFRILGRLTVLESDKEVTLGGDRQRRVLGVLLTSRGDRVSTDRLVDELWGEEPPATAATSLQVAVGKLRKALGPDAIKTVTGGYLLDVPAVDVDAIRFEMAVSDARAALRRGDPARAADLLRDGLALWRGDAYADVISGDATAAEAARLNEVRLGAIEDHVEARLALGEHASLVPALTELVAEHRYRERLHRQLILALYRSGRQAEALAAYTHVRALLVDDLGIDPSPGLAALEQQILGHDVTLDAPVSRSGARHFPAPPTSLVGRETELDQLVAMVAANVRIVTMTGPGGVGKTRLSLALLERLSSQSGDQLDLFFVDLAPLAGPDLMLPTLANALGVRDRPGTDPLAVVVEALQGHRSVVVMDNFESVLDAGPTLAEVVAGCPQLTVVVTSRERLSVSGEHEFDLRPLPLPAAVGSEDESAAVQLFCQRASEVRRGFVLDDSNAETVAELCRQLDGLPLALELAAARSKLLTPAALLERLSSDQLGTLSGGARDWPLRHRTLERTIAWSYDHLDPVERHVLQVCSVFAGGGTLPAIGHVAELDDDQTLTVVASLVDKSLLAPDQQAADDVRVRMLETVRRFAAGELTRSGQETQVRNLHAAWFATMAESSKMLVWSDNLARIAALDPEVDNLRAALSWLLDRDPPHDGVEMAAAMTHYWRQRAVRSPWMEWILQAHDAAEPGSTAAAVLDLLTAHIESLDGNLAAGLTRMHDNLAILRDAGEMLDYCNGLLHLCETASMLGEADAAVDAATDAVTFARTLDLPRLLALALAKLAVSLAERDDMDGAKVAMDEALATSPLSFDDSSSAGVILALSWVAILNGEHEVARDRLRLALDPAATSGRDVGWQMCYQANLAWAELALGETVEAVRHATAAALIGEQVGATAWQLEALTVLAASLVSFDELDMVGLVLGKAKPLVEAYHDAVDDYVTDAYDTALAVAQGPELAANMARGAGMRTAEIAALIQIPEVVPG